MPQCGAVQRLVYAEAARKQAALCARDAERTEQDISRMREQLDVRLQWLQTKQNAVAMWLKQAEDWESGK